MRYSFRLYKRAGQSANTFCFTPFSRSASPLDVVWRAKVSLWTMALLERQDLVIVTNEQGVVIYNQAIGAHVNTHN